MGAAGQEEESGPELFSRMREFFFSMTPAEAEVSPSKSIPHVYGIAMDMPIDGQLATVTALADGTSSLYLSNGYIIAGGYAAKDAAQRYVEVAERFLGQAISSTQHPRPRSDEVFFYIRTYDSLFVIRESLPNVLSRRSPYTEIYDAADQVIGQLFDAVEKAKAAEQQNE